MTWIKKTSFMLVFLLVFLPFLGYSLGGLYNFLPTFLLFTLVPFIDYLVQDYANPNDQQEQSLKKDWYFKAVTLIYVPVQIIFLSIAIYIVSTHTLIWYEWLGFCLSIGALTGGIGINLAHELVHKNNTFEQFAGKVLLSMVFFGHFLIEHVRGHHIWVGTPHDPDTAKLGENFYQFFPKAFIKSFIWALKFEKNRLQKNQRSFYDYHNQFWWIIFAPLAISVFCYILGGWSALLFFIGQAMIAIFILETVNYIEHYGLERQKLANGQYEKVSFQHSWNANHWLSNVILFQLQRHADHHLNGAKPYQVLKHIDESPQLPTGYLGMIFLALIPPLWHKVMDKRVLDYRSKHNIQLN
ncbi:alkane 1-monooxygenase [Legionella gresilensis]|uniref:alkane 1-monooxygenase n=1 Tax=Legionella gresilensis TaxID=91823 RepID=UPI00104193F3|nr:alkane 1-monooxygenase [Legionella gresilensis]